ncbi:MAG TPA: glycerophosphodiester phosphodiesterase family protein [Hanamia sp.]|nr:glycerophosphodiester phosphodiesterase family protein [Hanamia sp.]
MKNPIFILLFSASILSNTRTKCQSLNSETFALSNYVIEKELNSKPLTSIVPSVEKNYTYSISGKNAKWLFPDGNDIFVKDKFLKKISRLKQIGFSILIKQNNKVISKKSFTLLQNNFHQNKVIAHRGAWKNTGAPQNSLESLKAAIALGCVGSETDLHMTEDSALVINHDPVWAGLPVQKSTLSDLQKTQLSNGESLPLFEDFLKTIQQQHSTKLILEIKPSEKGRDWANATVKKVLEKIQEMQAQAWMVYISFDYEILKEILRREPSAIVQYLNGDKTPEQLKQDGIQGADYHYSVFQKHPEWIKSAKENDIALNVWTVNEEKELNWFLENDFDFITTNEPELLFEKIGK